MSSPLDRRNPEEPDLGVRAVAYLFQLRQIQRINGLLFALSFGGIFGGLILGFFWQTLGTILIISGFLVMGLLLLQSYAIYPRLRCPRCHRRFFLPDGRWHWLSRVNPLQKKCRHCGLSLGDRR